MENVKILIHEKTLKEPMADKEIDEKESLELKKIDNLNLDKSKKFLSSTQFKVEHVFVDIFEKDKLTQDLINKFTYFSSQNEVYLNMKFNCNFFKLRKEKNNIVFQSSAPLNNQILVNRNGFKTKDLLCRRTS